MAGPAALPLVLLQQAAGAIKGVVDEIRRLPDVVGEWVKAFNPASIARLDYAYQSLASTLGFSFEPIIIGATRYVEQFADAISGGMNRLRGPIEKVAGLLLGAMAPAFQAVGDVFDGLASAAEMLLPVFSAFAPVMEAAVVVLRTWVALGVESGLALLKGIIGEGETLRDVTGWLTTAFLKLAESSLLVSHFWLSMVGQEKILMNVLDRLSAPREAGGRRAPAPTGFSMGGLEDLYKRRLTEAAKGGGPDVAAQSRDYLAELAAIARELKDKILANPGAAGQQAGNAALFGAGGVALGLPELLNRIIGQLGEAAGSRQNWRNLLR